MPDNFHLLDRIGVELEYMIVDANSLDVRPIADELLRDAGGSAEFISDVERGPITWSNELVAHVIEMKTTEPVSPAQLGEVVAQFSQNVNHANDLLKRRGACLLPTAMHPWMNPASETKLWPHECADVYATFDRLFNCHRHGWANLQSIHVNLSFSGDQEFERLHAAVRLLLPILPALAASSPYMEGRPTGIQDTRLEVYRTNTESTPVFAGRVIPEPVWSEQQYKNVVLIPIAEELKRLDADGILQPEFTNSRGAIARFERGSLEIRLLDMQECPAADLAIAQIVIGTVQSLVEETWCSAEEQKSWSIERLERIFLQCIRDADGALIGDPDYLRAFGWKTPEQPVLARELWATLMSNAFNGAFSQNYQNHGCLSRRIISSCTNLNSKHKVYQNLAESLATNTVFQSNSM